MEKPVVMQLRESKVAIYLWHHGIQGLLLTSVTPTLKTGSICLYIQLGLYIDIPSIYALVQEIGNRSLFEIPFVFHLAWSEARQGITHQYTLFCPDKGNSRNRLNRIFVLVLLRASKISLKIKKIMCKLKGDQFLYLAIRILWSDSWFTWIPI